ncbi:MAG: hypothetical protein QNJ15_13245 [Erythrobacter sp.]|nr:hypothetical protein [Erythrobacter sp.]
MTIAARSPGRHRLLVQDLERQLMHWLAAARLFRRADEFASKIAWSSVEDEIGVPLRREIHRIVEELIELGEATAEIVGRAKRNPDLIMDAGKGIQRFRTRYTQVETTLDFLGDAVNSRTSPCLRAALRNLDRMAFQSMKPVLDRAGISCPQVLVYQDKGLGASIIRAGVRLWTPGSVMPVAAVKIVRHNLYRPTSLFHETGHQVAHLTRWVPRMQRAILSALAGDSELQQMWSGWASEIAADVYAFNHTGYASVAALYDVVGDARTIQRWTLGAPHPIGWLRVLLGCAFSREAYGQEGPWNGLETAMLARFPASRANDTLFPLLERSREAMPAIARACLDAPIPALTGKPLHSVVDPAHVAPAALAEFEHRAGEQLWTSPAWRETHGIRMVALTGLREAESPSTATHWIEKSRNWMTDRAMAA